MMVKRRMPFGELGILLLAPLILALGIGILFTLLGIFVIWLAVFWLLAAEVVMVDLVRRHLLRPRPALAALNRGAVPAGQ